MTPVRRALRFSAVTSVSIGALILTGCAVAPPPPPSAPAVDSETDTPAADAAVELLPEGTARDNLPYFAQELDAYARSDAPVQGRPLVDALAAAGFSAEDMQVTFDESRTGLVADSILVSVRFGEECLIGQVVTGDRSVTTTVQPALTDDRSICLIGNTRPIDWGPGG